METNNQEILDKEQEDKTEPIPQGFSKINSDDFFDDEFDEFDEELEEEMSENTVTDADNFDPELYDLYEDEYDILFGDDFFEDDDISYEDFDED